MCVQKNDDAQEITSKQTMRYDHKVINVSPGLPLTHRTIVTYTL